MKTNRNLVRRDCIQRILIARGQLRHCSRSTFTMRSADISRARQELSLPERTEHSWEEAGARVDERVE